MDLSWLRTFVVVAEERNLHRAAHRLVLTPGAVSKQIRRLERATRATLLERHPRGVSLTAAGEVLLPRAHELLDDWHATLATVADPQPRSGRAPLVLGVDDFGAGDLTVPLLAALRTAAPSGVVVRQVPEQRQFDALARGEIDLLLGGVLHLDPRLDVVVLAEQDRGVFLPRSAPLADADRVTVADVIDLPLTPFRPDMPQEWRRYWHLDEVRGAPPRLADTLVTDHTSLRAAVALDGAAAPSNATLGTQLAGSDVVYRPLVDVPPTPVSLAWRRRPDDDTHRRIAAAGERALDRLLRATPHPILRPPSDVAVA